MRNDTKSDIRPTSFHARRAIATLAGVLLASAAPGCTSTDEAEPTALQKAIDALGGQDALDAFHSLSIEASGTSAVIDEGFEAGGEARDMSTYTADIAIDVAGDSMRISYERDSLVMIPGTTNTFSEIVTDQVGYILGNELVFGAAPGYVGAPMSSARWASVRKQQRLSNPHLLLRGLTEADVTEGGLHDVQGRPHHLLTVPDPEGIHDITLFVDVETGVISRLSTLESDHLRGDVELAVSYERWERAGSLSVPRSVTITLDDQPVGVEERTAVQVDVELAPDLFAFPEGVELQHDEIHAHEGELNAQHHQRFVAVGTAPFFDWPSNTVQGVEIGQESGIYHLVGAGHHSLLIDQGDSLVLVEAPLHAARSEAILAWIDDNIAGGLGANPISHVIATHHHADHSAGLRTFALRGATIVVAEPAKTFLADIFSRPRTLDPHQAPADPDIQPEIATVDQDGSLTLGNVTAHHIPTQHAADMLIVHVTTAGTGGIIFNSDLYLPDLLGIIPGSVFVQGSKDLDDALIALGLDDETTLMLGGHGNVDSSSGSHFTVTYADFKPQLDYALSSAAP
jgi:glyoxylase-like metal-dependent hydrolase (beta-lactamase superfamily II)